MESVRIDRPKRTVPTPVDAFLEDRGDKKVCLYSIIPPHKRT